MLNSEGKPNKVLISARRLEPCPCGLCRARARAVLPYGQPGDTSAFHRRQRTGTSTLGLRALSLRRQRTVGRARNPHHGMDQLVVRNTGPRQTARTQGPIMGEEEESNDKLLPLQLPDNPARSCKYSIRLTSHTPSPPARVAPRNIGRDDGRTPRTLLTAPTLLLQQACCATACYVLIDCAVLSEAVVVRNDLVYSPLLRPDCVVSFNCSVLIDDQLLQAPAS